MRRQAATIDTQPPHRPAIALAGSWLSGCFARADTVQSTGTPVISCIFQLAGDYSSNFSLSF